MRKRIKARVRETKSMPVDFASVALNKGRKITHFRCEGRSGVIYDVHTIRYKGRLYFITSSLGVFGTHFIKDCIEL